MRYAPRTKPRKHQTKALQLIKSAPSHPSSADVYALLMEYGTGKSKIICDEFGQREIDGDLHDLLIVAGAGSYLNWIEDKNEKQPSEFHRHLSDDLNDRLRAEAWISGSGVRHQRRLEALLRTTDDYRPRALLMNIEALSTSKKARDMALAFLKPSGKKRRAMMVVDESTAIKDDASERTKASLVLAGEVEARRILTGLVTPNNPVDLYSQFEFLDWHILGYNSKWAFRNRYCVQKDIHVAIPGKTNTDGTPATRKVKIDVAYRNVDELYQKILPYSYRVLTKDCLDLPPLVYAPMIEVELTKEQRAIYDDMREFSTAQIRGEAHATATMVLTKNLRLQQLLCGFIQDDDGEIHDVPSNRGAAVMRLLEEHSGKAIIWVPFHRPLQRLAAALRKVYGPGSVAEFHGENKNTRGEEERRWLGDPDCRFMLSTQQAGGRGNTWVAANLTIYFANTHDLEIRMNSERRFYRDGQTQACVIADFTTRGTNEIKTVQALRDKLDIASQIMGDDPREWLI
jgi:SNF2 family DNA or RNA helicase